MENEDEGQTQDREEENPLVVAQKTIDELKHQNQVWKELVERSEKVQAMNMISGKANAGFKPPAPVETPQEYAAKVLRGELNDRN